MKKAHRVGRAALAATGIVAGVLVVLPAAGFAASAVSVGERQVTASVAKFELHSKVDYNCLVVAGDSIQVGGCGDEGALWSRLTTGDYFELQSQQTGKCIEEDGSQAIQAACDPNRAEQQGKMNNTAGGYFQVILRGSGQCLAVANDQQSVETQACDANKHEQQWKANFV